MQDLKAQRLNALVEGDELGGQEQAFKQWSGGVYKVGVSMHHFEKFVKHFYVPFICLQKDFLLQCLQLLWDTHFL